MTTKIMVIDDDTAVTDLLSVLLKSNGFDVQVANNSNEGLNLVRDEKFDLVILDLMMPEMDGWEICKEVRSFSQVPIIVLSALNDPSMVASVLDAGADDYLTKQPYFDCTYQPACSQEWICPHIGNHQDIDYSTTTSHSNIRKTTDSF